MKHPEKRVEQQITNIETTRLRPGRYQSRTRFPDEELSDSVRQHGVIEPLIIRGGPASYEIIAGERRWRAATEAGLITVPCIIRNDLSDEQAATITLVENIKRKSLSAIEEANGYANLVEEFGLTHELIALKANVSRSHVTNTLRLLQLSNYVQEAIQDGKLEAGHGRLLVVVKSQKLQEDYAGRAIHGGWSVKKLESAVNDLKALLSPGGKSKVVQSSDPDVTRLAQRLSERKGLPVKIDLSADKKGGTLHIKFFTLEDAEDLINSLMVGGGQNVDWED